VIGVAAGFPCMKNPNVSQPGFLLSGEDLDRLMKSVADEVTPIPTTKGDGPVKTIVLVVAVALVLLGSTSYSQEPNPFVGSWELVSHKSIRPDTSVVADMSELKSIKVLSQTHFAYVTTMESQDTTIVGAGAGPYSFDEKEYTEILEHSSFSMIRDGVYHFRYHIDGDVWTMTGDLDNLNVRIEEVWRRTR